MTDPARPDMLARAMLAMTDRERIAKLRQVAKAATDRADECERIANLYGGLLAVALHGAGAQAISAAPDAINEAVGAHGLLTIRVTPDGGAIAFWADDPPAEPVERPRLEVVQ